MWVRENPNRPGLVSFRSENWVLAHKVEVDGSVKSLDFVLDEQGHLDVFVLEEP